MRAKRRRRPSQQSHQSTTGQRGRGQENTTRQHRGGGGEDTTRRRPRTTTPRSTTAHARLLSKTIPAAPREPFRGDRRCPSSISKPQRSKHLDHGHIYQDHSHHGQQPPRRIICMPWPLLQGTSHHGIITYQDNIIIPAAGLTQTAPAAGGQRFPGSDTKSLRPHGGRRTVLPHHIITIPAEAGHTGSAIALKSGAYGPQPHWPHRRPPPQDQ